MSHALTHRYRLAAPVLLGLACVYGALVGTRPVPAVALVVVLLVLALAFLAPATHLSLLLVFTVIVPYSFQNRYSAGGAGTPELLLSDLLLLSGLARAAIVVPRLSLTRRQVVMVSLTVAFCAAAGLAAAHGIRAGRDLGEVGGELRTLLGFGTALIALPLLLDSRGRERLGRGLVAVGLLLGLWGVAQWIFGINYGAGSDFGLRPGVAYTEAGRGQVQGGLHAFPVAITIAAAVLIGGHARTRMARAVLVAVIGLNAVSLLLTYERTFWIVTVLGLVVVVLRTGRPHRGRAAVWGLVLATALFGVLATAAPRTLATAWERLLSVGQYRTDDSLRERRLESEHVLAEIREAPVLGSGLAAGVWYGRPWLGISPYTKTYAHNGYLWLVWKLGAIGASVLFLLVLLAVSWRGPPPESDWFAALRTGAQAALLGLLVANVTFPSFNTHHITCVIGLLLAICAMPRPQPIGRVTPQY